MTVKKAAHQLRIAQVIETMTMGGAENLAVRMANSLAARGYDSHLIVMGTRDILSDKVNPAVSVHYLEHDRSSVRNPLAFIVSLVRGLGLLARVIGRHKIQLVQTHLPGANFWGLLLELKKVCPVCATIHNNEEFRYGDTDNRLLLYCRRKAYQWILRRCHRTITVSDEVRSSLLLNLGLPDSAGHKISVVTNGVEIPEALPSIQRQEIRARFGVTEDVLLILAAGRFSEQKNFADLVTAAGMLRDKGLLFKLLIGGDGEQRPELEAKIAGLGLAEHVLLPGNLTDLQQVMQASDLFAMCSLWEGLPLVLLEAMACGLPPVAYGIAGVTEVISDGESGLVVPSTSPLALADAMNRMISQESVRLDLGLAARASVSKDFNFNRVIDDLAGIYKEIVA